MRYKDKQSMHFRSRIRNIYKKFIFRISASGCFIYPAFYRYFYNPAPGSLEEFACRYSRGRRPVNFIQVGANDGITNDPIHKFIKRDGWRGIVLEPQQPVCENYLNRLYSKTPGVTVINAALDKSDGEREIHKIAFSDARWATGLSSFRKEVLVTSLRSGYIKRAARKEGTSLPLSEEDYLSTENVKCISVATLMKNYGTPDLNWLQLDTEGFDFEIIKMFNLEEYSPEVIIYENLHFTKEEQQECTDYLKMKGYLCHDFGPDTAAMKFPCTGFEQYFDR